MKYAIYKIKPNKLNLWKDWCKELNTTHRRDALKTLETENLLFEGFIIFEIKGDTYTIGYSAEKEGGEQPSDSTNELNKKHREIKKECLEPLSRGESEYFLI